MNKSLKPFLLRSTQVINKSISIFFRIELAVLLTVFNTKEKRYYIKNDEVNSYYFRSRCIATVILDSGGREQCKKIKEAETTNNRILNKMSIIQES